MLLRWSLLLVTLAGFAASCSYDCNQFTCASGCCADGLCYEGKGARQGQQCSAVSGVGGGTGAGGGVGGGTAVACVDYNQGCNAVFRCCDEPTGMFNLVCRNERCDLCRNPQSDCDPQSSSLCCPGLSCQLRAGFTSVYECR